jgi:rare lipoprotein A
VQPQRARLSAPHDRNPFSGGLIGKLINSLSYAADPGETNVNAAVEAATAMASRASGLDDWKNSVDDDARKIRLDLGTFGDPGQEAAIATQFAMLGAVDEDAVETGGKPATRLTLTHLKPGVARADVLQLAQKLGLTGIVLY